MPTRADIHNQIVSDIAVKKLLEQRGDNQRASHTITHQVLAPSEAALAAFAETAKMLAFPATAIKPLERPDGALQFTCDFVTQNVTFVMLLARESVLMMTLAEAHGCTYNGWETQVVPAAPTGPQDQPTERKG